MRTVRIKRSRRSFATQALAWGNVLTQTAQWLARLFAGGYIDEAQQKQNFQAVRLEKVRLEMQVIEQRAHKTSNDVVIGDLRVEKLKMENELLKAKLRSMGVGTNFEVSDYSSDR